MAHLIRTVALGGWVLMGTWIAPRMGSMPLEVAREQLQAGDARVEEPRGEEARQRETPVPNGRAPQRPMVPPPTPPPMDASVGCRI